MALIFADGFDLYSSRADLELHGWDAEGTVGTQTDLSLTEGRFGGGALKVISTNSQGFVYTFPTGAKPVAGTTLIIQFSYKSTDITDGSAETLVRVRNSGGSDFFHLTQLGTTGALSLTHGTGTVALTGVLPCDGNWHYIKIKCLFGTLGTNGTFEIYIDEVLTDTLTGIDTHLGGNPIDNIRFAGLGGIGQAWWDDIIIMDTSGSRMNDYIDPVKIETFAANADGGVVDWTASAGSDVSCVDDVPNAHNGDTDYIESSTAAQESRFGMANLADTPTLIHAVQVRLNVKQQTAGDTYRGLMNSGGTEQVGATLTPPAAYTWDRNLIQDVDPATSASWTKSGIDALEVGAEVVAAGGGATRITAVAMEVLRSISAVGAGGGAKPITCVIAS